MRRDVVPKTQLFNLSSTQFWKLHQVLWVGILFTKLKFLYLLFRSGFANGKARMVQF